MTPLTSAEKQSRRIAELDAIAQAAGWATWTQYATAVKNGIVSIATNPATSRANPLTRAGGKRGGRVNKEMKMSDKKEYEYRYYENGELYDKASLGEWMTADEAKKRNRDLEKSPDSIAISRKWIRTSK